MITAVLVGLGHRGVGYATYADSHPDELQIVGVAEPDHVRRERYAERFGVPVENCFESAEDFKDVYIVTDLMDSPRPKRWIGFKVDWVF